MAACVEDEDTRSDDDAKRVPAPSAETASWPGNLVHVSSAELYCPDLQWLADELDRILSAGFKSHSVEVVDCPDLREWGLAAQGLCGNCQLVEVGGPPFLMDPKYHDVTFSFRAIADRIGFPGAYFIGAGAGRRKHLGMNSELISCDDTSAGGARKSRFAVVDAKSGRPVAALYDHDDFGLMVNALASRGEPGPVLKITAAGRIGGPKDNFVGCMRKGLATAAASSASSAQERHIGMGGVFKVKKGKIRAHCMPDFKPTVMQEGPEVDEWLRWYELGPGMVCLSYLVSGDPTGGSLNLRLEHTHFFDPETNEGGHYHFSTTPDECEYEGYFVPAARVTRIDDPKLFIAAQ